MNQQAEVIDLPTTHEEQKAVTIKDQAQSLIITDAPGYERAKELLLSIKDLRKQISDTFKPIIEKAYQAHRTALFQQKKVETPLIEAEGIIKPRIATFLAAEESKRRADEDRLRRIAEQEAEERRLADALAAEADGDMDEVDAILDEPPAYVPPPIVQRTVTTGGGISVREVWSFELTDLKALVKAVAEGKVPLAAIHANTAFLGQQARSLKGELQYPGVRVFSTSSVAAGRR